LERGEQFTGIELYNQHIGGVGIGDKTNAFGGVQGDVQEVMFRLGWVNLHARSHLRRFAIQGDQFAFAGDGVNFVAGFIDGKTDRIHLFQGMRKRLVLRVDNPQHAFAFTANPGDVEPLVFLIEYHFADVRFVFIIRELERFHFFVGAGIQQG
jgi:hypothetical protein